METASYKEGGAQFVLRRNLQHYVLLVLTLVLLLHLNFPILYSLWRTSFWFCCLFALFCWDFSAILWQVAPRVTKTNCLLALPDVARLAHDIWVDAHCTLLLAPLGALYFTPPGNHPTIHPCYFYDLTAFSVMVASQTTFTFSGECDIKKVEVKIGLNQMCVIYH